MLNYHLRENNLFIVGVLEGDHFIALISGKKFKVVNAVKEPEGVKIDVPVPDPDHVEVQSTSQIVDSAVFGEKIVKLTKRNKVIYFKTLQEIADSTCKEVNVS